MNQWIAGMSALLASAVILTLLPSSGTAGGQPYPQRLGTVSYSQADSGDQQAVSPAAGNNHDAASEPAAYRLLESRLPESLDPPSGGVVADSFREAVNRLFAELASQPGFESWSQAAWTSHPLGPGTHGWVVIVHSGQEEVGYMVIHAAEDGSYRLTEYGTGPFPLFSLSTLYRSLVQHELISSTIRLERLYLNPLQAYWKVTGNSGPDHPNTIIFDAKTGEKRAFEPDDPEFQRGTEEGAKKRFTSLTSEHILYETGQTKPFDVYASLTWFISDPASEVTFDQLKAWIANHRRTVAAAELYDGAFLLPLAVTGYHLWSGNEAFVQVYQDDERYIPFHILKETASFFP